jgi:sugar phosphate permease
MSEVQWRAARYVAGLFAAGIALAFWLRARDRSHPIPENLQKEIDDEPGWWTSGKGDHDA